MFLSPRVFTDSARAKFYFALGSVSNESEKYSTVFQETVAPTDEKPRAAETSAPVKEAIEVAAPTPAESGVSLNVSKGDNY